MRYLWVLLLSVAAYGQVHVKESVTITPKDKNVSEIQSHTIRFKLWCHDPAIAFTKVRVEGPCDFDSVYTGLGDELTVELAMPTAGEYKIYSYFKLVNETLPTEGVHYNLSFDDNQSEDYEGSVEFTSSDDWIQVNWMMYGDFFQAWLDFTTPFYSTFDFGLGARVLFYGEESGLGMGGVYDCGFSSWMSSDPVTLTIVKGEEYATFRKIDFDTQTEVDAGRVVTTTGDDLWYHYLSATGVRPDTGEVWVVVKAESDEMTGLDSLMVFPGPVVVNVTPNVLSPGDTASVELKKRNEDGTTSDFSPDELFEAGVIGNERYGGTILSASDTSAYFLDIPAGFRFIADRNMTVDSETVGVRVGIHPTMNGVVKPKGNEKGKTQNKTARITGSDPMRLSDAGTQFQHDVYGIGLVEIRNPEKRYQLRIVHHEPWAIWPSLPKGSYDSREKIDGYEPTRPFVISVTDQDGNPPEKPMTVEIRHDYQQGSGGHAHVGTRDFIPDQKLQGTFWSHGAGGPYLDLPTDNNGLVVIDSLVASQISGIYLITAFLKVDPTEKDTVNLKVRVPELVNFQSWTLLIYYLYPKAFTYMQSEPTNHPENLNCTQAMAADMFWSALDFYFWSGSREGGKVPVVLSLNDMSLEWGGLFDGVHVNWLTPHSYHRIGRSVDINQSWLFQHPDPKNEKIPVLTSLGLKLEKQMKNHGGHRIPEGSSVHYEFRNDK